MSNRTLRDHPSLLALLDQIETELRRSKQLGLISISALRRTAASPADRWEDYEAILREIAVFLDRFRIRRMRRTDQLLSPAVAGNTFVIVMGPPREDRSLHREDLKRLRRRLSQELNDHLALSSSLSPQAIERYGVFVGGASIRFDPVADSRRVIYRGLEESVADALRQVHKEDTLHAERLESIFAEKRLSMVYQPVVDTMAQEVIGFEALTRLPAGQFRSPDVMFKVATELGTLWRLERLCRQRALETLPPMFGEQKLFLNLEPDSFYDPRLREQGFVEELSAVGLSPSRLVLELTEHAAVHDFVALRRVLDEVRSLGYRLALDDVGSGYSGLQAIAEIRPDYLKVDMALIRNVHLDPIKRELISTIRRFADSTGITLVAEGVETQEELESLTGAGVRCAQGFLFARPDSPPAKPDWQQLETALGVSRS